MKLLSTVLPLAALASAFDIGPGAKQQRRDRLRTQMKRGEPCNVGQIYCLDQVVYELGMSFPPLHPSFRSASSMSLSLILSLYDAKLTVLGVGMQDILHQYCDQQYTIDALSCHACKKFPTPAPECAAAYPAWNSAFTCEGNNQYTFAKRCDEWCAGGECVPKP
jgi:hypothetical protein